MTLNDSQNNISSFDIDKSYSYDLSKKIDIHQDRYLHQKKIQLFTCTTCISFGPDVVINKKLKFCIRNVLRHTLKYKLTISLINSILDF